MKLMDLDFKRFKAICERLDIDSAWRGLIQVTSNTRYQLNDIETEKCARSAHTGGSPSLELLKRWGMASMSVETLAHYLDELRIEDCLRFIKQPEPLRIVRQPLKEIRICGGKRLEVTCEAVGFPYPEYVWFKGRNRVSKDKQGSLVVRSAKPSDSGTYTCRVQHHQGEWKWIMSSECKVKVDPANDHDLKLPPYICTLEEQFFNSGPLKSICTNLPQIILQPTNKTSAIGGPVIFRVEAQHPADRLAFVWYHNKKPIPNAHLNELRIDDVSKEHAGTYQVRIYSTSNSKVEALSREAKLEVVLEPNQFTARDKVALVIGNGSYRSYGQALPAVEFDLHHTTEALERMGFEVVALLDLTLEEMRKALDFFCHLVIEGAYVVFYCMGHGFLYDGRHYLIPWDLPQGNDVKESLCIEACMRQIQETRPRLLMVLVDLCRQPVEHSQTEQIHKEKPTKGLPNYVIIYATILGEQSFEEGGNMSRPRGLFNKYLLDVLMKPEVKITEIYSLLQDKFQQCPYNRDKYPQHPQMDITLEEPERSLWDPVVSSKQNGIKVEADAIGYRNIRRTIHVIPGSVHIPLENRGLVELTFSKYLSNVLLMRPVVTNFDPSAWRIEIGLIKDRVNQVIQPVKVEGSCPQEYKFCNLQRLKNKLTICMAISIIVHGEQPFQLETELINLGEPLAASLDW